MLLQFARSHPEIDLTLDFEDRLVDLMRENYDLAIRITSERSESNSPSRLGTVRHALYASPEYLDRHGFPQTPSALNQHTLLHFGAARRPVWTFGYEGKPVSLTFKSALNSNDGAFLVEAASAGLGIIRLPRFVAKDAEDNAKLVQILTDAVFPELSICVLTAPNRRLNKRMRAFVEAAQTQCAAYGV
jgi:DNA-binding transcriptional LysR family regulator